jgi:hypothetical protein
MIVTIVTIVIVVQQSSLLVPLLRTKSTAFAGSPDKVMWFFVNIG